MSKEIKSVSMRISRGYFEEAKVRTDASEHWIITQEFVPFLEELLKACPEWPKNKDNEILIQASFVPVEAKPVYHPVELSSEPRLN